VLCAVTIPHADLRSFGFVLLRSMWQHVYVICVCLVFLSVGDLHVHKQITKRQERQTHTDDTHATTHCVIIQNQTKANQRDEK
jgi:hypothetical protein